MTTEVLYGHEYHYIHDHNSPVWSSSSSARPSYPKIRSKGECGHDFETPYSRVGFHIWGRHIVTKVEERLLRAEDFGLKRVPPH